MNILSLALITAEEDDAVLLSWIYIGSVCLGMTESFLMCSAWPPNYLHSLIPWYQCLPDARFQFLVRKVTLILLVILLPSLWYDAFGIQHQFVFATLLHLNAIPLLLLAITPNSLPALVPSKHYHSCELHRVSENWWWFDFFVTQLQALLLRRNQIQERKILFHMEKYLNQSDFL